jgi:hypothetical protein
MFNVARLPQLQCDSFSLLPPDASPNARSIVVVVHDWFYAVEVLDSSCRLMTPRELERRLYAIVLDVNNRILQGEAGVPISVLTADSRDNWAAASLTFLTTFIS